jgi:hypothetical protein
LRLAVAIEEGLFFIIMNEIKIIDIKIKNATILLSNLKEEEVTSYKINYLKNKKEKTFSMWTFNNQIKPFTEKELIKDFYKKIL